MSPGPRSSGRMSLPDLAWPPPADWIRQAQGHGAILLRGVPLDADNQSLRQLADQLGSRSLRGLSQRLGLVEKGAVQRVQALSEQALDQYGKILKSASNQAFAAHTDESFCAQPARWLLLHCWQSAAVAGDSFWVDSQSLIRRVGRETRIALEQMRLPYPCGDRVTVEADGRVRFNVDEVMAASSRSGISLTLAQQAWIRRFAAAFAANAQRIHLESEDLLVIDNWRVLHGRSAFAADSGRLLKRIRVL